MMLLDARGDILAANGALAQRLGQPLAALPGRNVFSLLPPDVALGRQAAMQQAVEAQFKVKVEEVRTVNNVGKLRRRGRFSGFRSDWKKAYVRLKAGEKMPEYAEI